MCAGAKLRGKTLNGFDGSAISVIPPSTDVLPAPDVRIVSIGVAIAIAAADAIDVGSADAACRYRRYRSYVNCDDLHIRQRNQWLQSCGNRHGLLEPRKATKTLEPLEPAKSPVVGRNTRDAGT